MPGDNKNLNRVFPGSQEGTPADRVAHFFEYSLYSQIDFYIDLHCGEIFEDLTPYVYYVGAADETVSRACLLYTSTVAFSESILHYSCDYSKGLSPFSHYIGSFNI